MTIDTKTLRSQLMDFRTRKSAINEAVAAGDEAVEPAVALLKDRKETVRWSAIRILSEIGDPRAIEPLIELVERGRSALEAANALRTITEQNFGEDGAAWRKWASGSADLEVAPEMKTLTEEELIRAATEELSAKVTTKKGRYLVTLDLPGERSQTIYVVFSAKDAEGEPIVWLYTPCCEANPDKYEWALKYNLRLPYGAIGIAKIDNVNCFVMSNTHLRATVDPEDITKSLLALASKGDAVEKMLSGEDKR